MSPLLSSYFYIHRFFFVVIFIFTCFILFQFHSVLVIVNFLFFVSFSSLAFLFLFISYPIPIRFLSFNKILFPLCLSSSFVHIYLLIPMSLFLESPESRDLFPHENENGPQYLLCFYFLKLQSHTRRRVPKMSHNETIVSFVLYCIISAHLTKTPESNFIVFFLLCKMCAKVSSVFFL